MKQLGVLAFGGALRIGGLALGAMAQAWTARRLGPEAYGISGYIQSLVLFGVVLVDLGQAPAHIRNYLESDGEEDRRRLLGGVMLLRGILCLGILLAGFVFLTSGVLSSSWMLPGCCGILLLLFSCNQGTWILQARDLQGHAFLAIFLRQGFFAAGAFAWIKPGMQAGTDLILQVLAALVAFGFEWTVALKGGVAPIFGCKPLLRALHDAWQARWLTLTTLTTAGYAWSELPIIRWRLGEGPTGLYRSAYTVGMAVSALIAVASSVLYPRLVRLARQDMQGLRKEVNRVCIRAGWGGCILLLLSWPVLDRLYVSVFGPDYGPATVPCFLVLGGKAVSMVGMGLATALRAIHRERAVFWAASSAAGLSVALNVILLPRFGIGAAAATYVLCEATVLVWLWVDWVKHHQATAPAG